MDKSDRIIDGNLVKAFQDGDNKALVSLVKRWHKNFCENAFWIIKDADVAKDVAQDCWQIIMGKIHSLKTPESFGGWALRIVYNKSIDYVNSNNRKIKALDDIKKDSDNLQEVPTAENIELKEALLRAIQSLPEAQQTVVKLFYVQEYSLKEIANILSISEGTAKSRLFHAREKLKLILKNKNYKMSQG